MYLFTLALLTKYAVNLTHPTQSTRLTLALVLAALMVTGPAFAKGHSSYKSASGNHRSSYTQGVKRDSKGRIKRSSVAKNEFMKKTGHPNGWSGHVVDHVVPLKRGGADRPENMQWQTTAAAKAKDKVE